MLLQHHCTIQILFLRDNIISCKNLNLLILYTELRLMGLLSNCTVELRWCETVQYSIAIIIHSWIISFHYRPFQNYAAIHRQNLWRKSCNGLPSIKQKFYLETFYLNPIASKTLICNNWLIKIDLRIIFLNKTLKMLGSCLIDGSPLQLSHHEFCLWWLRSFENAGKRQGDIVMLILFTQDINAAYCHIRTWRKYDLLSYVVMLKALR